jgi:hypothetical protein
MAARSRAKTYGQALGAVFTLGLALSACGGDDDDAPAGSGGSLNLSGATAGDSSPAGALTSGGSGGQAAASADAGAGGESSTVAGSSSGGSSSGGTGSYLPCASAADCKQYGGGKVCCDQVIMVFCTKPSACSGKTLP